MKLDKFLPNPDVVAGVKRQLIEAGVHPDSVPQDWLIATIAAMTKWQCQTAEGAAHVVNSLGFQWSTGKDEFQYDYHHTDGSIHRLKPNQIHFFAGAAINGKPVHPRCIVASKKQTAQCDGCGATTHCVKTVRDPSRDRLETLCNTCLTSHEISKVREHGRGDMCRRCTTVDCYHHPQSEKALRA